MTAVSHVIDSEIMSGPGRASRVSDAGRPKDDPLSQDEHSRPNSFLSPSENAGGTGPQKKSDTQIVRGSGAVEAAPLIMTVRLHAALLDDLEDVRTRHVNRMRANTAADPEIGAIVNDTDTLNYLKAAESAATLRLKRAFRQLQIAQFVKDTPGLGEKTVARWLGEVGDPAWHSRDDRPRRLSELYAYCGLHVVDGKAPGKRKGQQANWSNGARVRAHNMATACVKAVGGADSLGRVKPRSPYRDMYDEAREKYADATYEDGSPLTDLHKHNRAVRAVMKAIVKDLWTHSKDTSVSNPGTGGSTT